MSWVEITQVFCVLVVKQAFSGILRNIPSLQPPCPRVDVTNTGILCRTP
jgi:hypothetical protein